MGVLDGQPVSAPITNPAFINKNQNDLMANILGFTRTLSGNSIADIQVAVNKLYTCTGASETQTGTVYNAPAGTFSDGDSHETALAVLANKFDAATGHKHTGAAGDAPPISGGYVIGVPYEQFVNPAGTLLGVTGSSWDVSSVLTGKTASTNSTTLGVITNTPYNRTLLANGFTGNLTDSLIDSSGNIVYGRLTHSGSVWTLSFYTIVVGFETAYTFSTSQDITWYYRELYIPLVNTPVYEPNYLDFESKTVHSISASGYTALWGDVVVRAASGTLISQFGEVMTLTADFYNSSAMDVSSAGATGTSLQVSHGDHVHRGVHSLAATGQTALYGDVVFQAASGVLLTETGQNLQYTADFYTTAASVGSANAAGTSNQVSRGDHVHQGVHSIAATGSSALFGDVVFQAASGVVLSESGQDLLYSADFSTTAVSVGSANAPGTSLQVSRGDHVHQGIHSIAATGSSALFGDVIFQAASGVVLSESGQDLLYSADFSTTAVSVGSANAPGTSLQVSRGDHVHQGIHSIAASGSSALFGDVIFQAASGVVLSESGQNVLYSADYSATAASVGSANAPGTSLQVSRGDHVHQGVHSVAISGGSQIFGDATLVAGSGIILGATGNNISITSNAVGGVTSIAASGSSPLTGAVVLAASGSIIITEVGNTIFIASSGGGGGTTSPLTTKGDVYGYDTGNNRIPVGSSGQRLIADANAALGVRYQDQYPKNYIINNDAEVAATTGWASYANSAANIPSTGTGGTATGLTFTASASSPLAGIESFLINQANSTSLQGKGVSYDFTIDSKDQANVLAIQFNYNADTNFTAGDGSTTPLNDGTTTTNAGNSDIEVFIYDKTNAVLIYCTPQVLTGKGTNNFIFKSIFQTASNSTSYRLILHCATTHAPATGYNLKFDNVFVGPQSVSYGPPVSDANPYTLTIGATTTPPTLGTITTNLATWTRVGDCMVINYNLVTSTNGSAGSGTYLFPLPSGYTIDSSKVLIATNVEQGIVGPASLYSSFSGELSAIGYVKTYNSTNLALVTAVGKGTGTVTDTFNVVGNSSWGLGNAVTYSFVARVPILGWSSTVLMSNDTDTRIVAAQYTASSQGETSNQPMNFNNLVYDTHSAVTTGASWKFLAPVSGYYTVNLNASNATGNVNYQLYKNGSLFVTVVNGGLQTATGVAKIKLVAGDYIDMREDQGYTFNGTISITRDSGPASIATSDSVNAEYSSASTQSINNNTATTVIWPTKNFDSFGGMNIATGVYTVPSSGKYFINVILEMGQSSGGRRQLTLQKNGSDLKNIENVAGASANTSNQLVHGSALVSLVAGDTVSIVIFQNSGGTVGLFPNGTAWSTFSINRVGN